MQGGTLGWSWTLVLPLTQHLCSFFHSTGKVPSDFQAPLELTEFECARPCSLVFPDASRLLSDLFLLKTPQQPYSILGIVWSAPGFSLKAPVLRKHSVGQQHPKIHQSKGSGPKHSPLLAQCSSLCFATIWEGFFFLFLFCCFWFGVLSKCWCPVHASRDSEIQLLASF